MAIVLATQYSPDVTAPDLDYPYGSAKNVSTPTGTDGTPWEKAYIDNLEGFFQSILQAAGETPNGNADTVRAPQLLSALVNNQYYQFIDYKVGTRVIFNETEFRCIQENGPGSTVVAPDAGNSVLYWEDTLLAARKADNPIGTIRVFDSDDHPATLLGFGVWVPEAAGRAIFGISTIPSSPFDTNGRTGGSTEHSHASGTLTGADHSHSAGTLAGADHILTVAEMPQHNHGRGIILSGVGKIEGYTGNAPDNDNYSIQVTANEGLSQPHSHGVTGSTGATGIGIGGNTATTSILPPYVVRRVWKRTG